MWIAPLKLMKQSGQALTEAVVLLLVLAVLWVIIPYLGKVADLQLKTQHAANLRAWRATQDSAVDASFAGLEQSIIFQQASTRWTNRPSQPTLNIMPTNTHWTHFLSTQLGRGLASEMRQAWGLDKGLYIASTGVDLSSSHVINDKAELLGLRAWFDHSLNMSSSLGVLVGAGHASSRLHTQQKISASQSAWGSSYQRSLLASQAVTDRMRRVDDVWGRAEPNFSWVSPWSDEMPTYHKTDD